ncbi:IS6 family transposase [Streptomyces barringtoniae]|uniref:IS6 family transposase n=1 Tax=Streptomyces barringtoniae TaxID=2892029 RepID=UPI001E3F0A20|nr:IS6 family transposase [Streptomyces barringtoniae]MCC5480486.1 IS6 family transposase [Streptomyces barringtoniae]
MECAAPSYKGFRFPPEVIAHAVWLYHRFPLTFRDVDELLFERGIQVSYETVRLWCERFGPEYARRLRRRQPRPGDKWHLDEVFLKVNGRTRYLWRAVDRDGNVLDVLVTNSRDTKAAKRFFLKLLTGTESVPRVVVTDKLRSYGAPHRQAMPSVEHHSSKYMNNRAENSHLPTRQREYAMQGFRSVGSAQRFLASFSRISPHFRPRRHRMTAADYRTEMTDRHATWHQITDTTPMTTVA